MSRRRRGEAPQDNSPVDPDLMAYFKTLVRLEEFLPHKDISKLVSRWKDLRLDASQKRQRAQSLLEWEEKQPGWLMRTYGPK